MFIILPMKTVLSICCTCYVIVNMYISWPLIYDMLWLINCPITFDTTLRLWMLLQVTVPKLWMVHTTQLHRSTPATQFQGKVDPEVYSYNSNVKYGCKSLHLFLGWWKWKCCSRTLAATTKMTTTEEATKRRSVHLKSKWTFTPKLHI